MLLEDVKKYINHKIRLSQVSEFYKRPQVKSSLIWAYDLAKQIQFQSQYLSEQNIALIVKNSYQHLYNLLPCDQNKSYKSSCENYQKIIAQANKILTPKTNIYENTANTSNTNMHSSCRLSN